MIGTSDQSCWLAKLVNFIFFFFFFLFFFFFWGLPPTLNKPWTKPEPCSPSAGGIAGREGSSAAAAC